MSLTYDWKAGRLPCMYYWVKLINDDITIGFFDGLEFSCCKNFCIKEVLAPCDYEELQRLKEENADLQVGADSLRELNKIMRCNYDNKVDSLRELLKKCKVLFEAEKKFLVKCSRMEDIDDILTRINAAIGESEGR